jgi:hypothetical protein
VNGPGDVRRVENFPIVSRIENLDSLAVGTRENSAALRRGGLGAPLVTAMPSRFTLFIVAK